MMTAFMVSIGCVGSTYNVAHAAGWFKEPVDSTSSDEESIGLGHKPDKKAKKGTERYAPDGPDLESGAPGPPKKAFQ